MGTRRPKCSRKKQVEGRREEGQKPGEDEGRSWRAL